MTRSLVEERATGPGATHRWHNATLSTQTGFQLALPRAPPGCRPNAVQGRCQPTRKMGEPLGSRRTSRHAKSWACSPGSTAHYTFNDSMNYRAQSQQKECLIHPDQAPPLTQALHHALSGLSWRLRSPFQTLIAPVRLPAPHDSPSPPLDSSREFASFARATVPSAENFLPSYG